jgi:hypothetical protein
MSSTQAATSSSEDEVILIDSSPKPPVQKKKLTSLSPDEYNLRFNRGITVADPINQPTELNCSICIAFAIQPVMVYPCEHVFCYMCYHTMVDVRVRAMGAVTLPCPNCRQNIRSVKALLENGRPTNAMGRIYFNTKVKCGFHHSDHPDPCLWEGELSKCESHQKKCTHQLKICSNGCGDYVYPTKLTEHELECPCRKQTCETCQQAVFARDWEQHPNVCKKKVITCDFPNDGCQQQVVRDQMEFHRSHECKTKWVYCPYRKEGCSFCGPKPQLQRHLEDPVTLKHHLDCLHQALHFQTRMMKQQAYIVHRHLDPLLLQSELDIVDSYLVLNEYKVSADLTLKIDLIVEVYESKSGVWFESVVREFLNNNYIRFVTLSTNEQIDLKFPEDSVRVRTLTHHDSKAPPPPLSSSLPEQHLSEQEKRFAFLSGFKVPAAKRSLCHKETITSFHQSLNRLMDVYLPQPVDCWFTGYVRVKHNQYRIYPLIDDALHVLLPSDLFKTSQPSEIETQVTGRRFLVITEDLLNQGLLFAPPGFIVPQPDPYFLTFFSTHHGDFGKLRVRYGFEEHEENVQKGETQIVPLIYNSVLRNNRDLAIFWSIYSGKEYTVNVVTDLTVPDLSTVLPVLQASKSGGTWTQHVQACIINEKYSRFQLLQQLRKTKQTASDSAKRKASAQDAKSRKKQKTERKEAKDVKDSKEENKRPPRIQYPFPAPKTPFRQFCLEEREKTKNDLTVPLRIKDLSALWKELEGTPRKQKYLDDYKMARQEYNQKKAQYMLDHPNIRDDRIS